MYGHDGVAGSRRQGKMTSIDLRRTINAPTWTDFRLFLQRELTIKVYKTKRSSTEWFIWRRSVCMYVRARFRKRRENEVTCAPNSQSQSRINEFQQIKQNRAIFVWMKKNKDFIKVRRKQSYNKHLIRRLTSQYGRVFLLVKLYFGSSKGSPKYCRLVKIPSHIGRSTVW